MRAASVQLEVQHPGLVPLEAVVHVPDGVLVVHEWFEGELLRSPPERRDHPDEAGTRFRALPVPEVAAALDRVIDLHVALERAGWVAGDLYDGALMYDFAARSIVVVDLECYQRGPYLNEVGRLPGSTRFMAPEEHRRGALVDERTTVFNLGRLLELSLPDPRLAEVVAAATDPDRARRPPSVAALQEQWRAALPHTG